MLIYLCWMSAQVLVCRRVSYLQQTLQSLLRDAKPRRDKERWPIVISQDCGYPGMTTYLSTVPPASGTRDRRARLKA